MTRRFMIWLAAAAACAASLHAQAPRRLPVITGAMGVNLVVDGDGSVRSWGFPGAEGTYLGDGSDDSADRKLPMAIPGVRDIVDAAVGHSHALLLSRDGTVFTWGRNNGCELGVDDERRRLTPIRVTAVQGVVQVAAGMNVSAVVLRDGTVRLWGSNADGLLANGKSGYDADCAVTPVAVDGLSGVKRMVLTETDALVLKQDGTVWGWGSNEDGLLCDGSTERRTRPVQMRGITNAVDIAMSGNSVIVLADGTVRMCGRQRDRAMSTAREGSVHTLPFQVAGITSAVAAQTAGGSTIVRLKDGTLLGWGYGMHGSLGDGFIDRISPTPHAPIGVGPVLAHFFASNEAYAVRADGTVMAWGFFTGGAREWALKPVPRFTVTLER